MRAIPESLLSLVPQRFDIIGKVAVLSIPPELDAYKVLLAEDIVMQHKNIKTVLNKVARVNGDNRVGRFEIVLGEATLTMHREYGYAYLMDVKTVFFNPRLAFERHRVTSQIGASEHVVILFCGVGPFAVPAAAQGARVIALEKNASACKWLAENSRLNRVDENISIILCDACTITNLIRERFDRAIVPAPYGMDGSLRPISELVKKGGMIHFYTFKKQHQIESLLDKYARSGFEIVFYRRCGNVAPAVSRWVFDLKKQ